MQLFYNDQALHSTAVSIAAIVPGCRLCLVSELIANNNRNLSQNKNKTDLKLLLKYDGLWLYSLQFKPLNLKLYYENFIQVRRRSLNNEILLKAINLKFLTKVPIFALDLTAGFGRDAILMSLYGYQVTMVENNPFLALILNFLRLTFAAYLPNLNILYADNYEFLKQKNTHKYDLIYLDPMFEDGKQALAKKEIQMINLCISQAERLDMIVNNEKLFAECKKHCTQKIIVKRDNKQPWLVSAPKPTYSKVGKTVRFDVYQCTK